MIDTRALHPLKILIESDRYLEPELITSAFTQLQALPSPVTGNEKDTTEYITVLSLLCRSLLRMDTSAYLNVFIAITKGTIAYFLTPDMALHKSIAMFLIDFYPSLSPLISQCFPEDIAQQFVQLYLDTLQFRYQHAWTYLLPVISAMVRLIGPVYPNLFTDLLQQLLAIYDSSVKGDSAYLSIPSLISRFQMILTKTMGYCVEALGPEVFINIVPIVVRIEFP